MTRIAIYGRSGSGKSTLCALLEAECSARCLKSARIKLAEPLYRLQREVYTVAGVVIENDQQDQLLMESLARHLRRINPRALAEDFLSRLREARADVVLNDDLRDPHVDANVLRQQSFFLVRISCASELRRARLAGRQDRTIHPTEPSAMELDLIEPDLVIENDGSLDDLAKQAGRLLSDAG